MAADSILQVNTMSKSDSARVKIKINATIRCRLQIATACNDDPQQVPNSFSAACSDRIANVE